MAQAKVSSPVGPTLIGSPYLHQENFTIYPGQKYRSPNYHKLSAGFRVVIYSNWSPSAVCFVGMYKMEGNYSVGLNGASPLNYVLVLGSTGNWTIEVRNSSGYILRGTVRYYV
jgi:hypothetical protein